MYIVIGYPDIQQNCSIHRFDNLDRALEDYEILKSYGADPILAKVLNVKMTVEVEDTSRGRIKHFIAQHLNDEISSSQALVEINNIVNEGNGVDKQP